MENLKQTDSMLRMIASSITDAQKEAARAFRTKLAGEAKIILGALPHDDPDGDQRPPECLCDGLLVDVSSKDRTISRATAQSSACARYLDRIFTQSGLTPMERTVMIRLYIDNRDKRLITTLDGYTNVDALLEAALEKISRTMPRAEISFQEQK